MIWSRSWSDHGQDLNMDMIWSRAWSDHEHDQVIGMLWSWSWFYHVHDLIMDMIWHDLIMGTIWSLTWSDHGQGLIIVMIWSWTWSLIMIWLWSCSDQCDDVIVVISDHLNHCVILVMNLIFVMFWSCAFTNHRGPCVIMFMTWTYSCHHHIDLQINVFMVWS